MDSAGDETAAKSQNAPLFTTIAAVLFVLCLTTPIIMLSLPVMLTVGAGVVALFRKEKLRWIAVLAIILSALLMFAASAQIGQIGSRGTSTADLSSVRLSDWSWEADREFGTRGTIKWRVAVQNLTQRAIDNVKVDFSSYDRDGRLLTSTFTYVHAIPPGGSRTEESFADLYGTENRASAVVTEVRFSGE
ncbi:MAG TPA: FxLYD domain-containing protein [Allosphingosinicella sp.]|jgi:hypothetical protein